MQLPSQINLELLSKYEIDSELRIAHFVSQCEHESGEFKFTLENLDYSATALLATFPKYFHNFSEANDYARNAEKIANKVYANRMGNGNEESGDGWFRRGRGYIQITGTENQIEFFTSLGLERNTDPALISEKYALESACWFWKTRNLNILADSGSSIEVITNITKKINGGTNGLQDRINLFNKYYSNE